MERQSALILFSGIESHVSADEYAPFEADRNFFYLTGLRRDHMILLMKKTLKEEQVILFIEEADPTQERWYGRKVTVDEAKEISGIDNVMFLDSFEGAVDRMMAREDIDSLYFDCYRYQFEDMPDYNMIKAKEFAEKYLQEHPITDTVGEVCTEAGTVTDTSMNDGKEYTWSYGQGVFQDYNAKQVVFPNKRARQKNDVSEAFQAALEEVKNK